MKNHIHHMSTVTTATYLSFQLTKQVGQVETRYQPVQPMTRHPLKIDDVFITDTPQ